ncbi:phosphatase 2C-like domain-containing protein [Flammula alnicola]|nr:phosphatase 2C-like domain-containing protein [Flammula alnicola]
MDIASNNPVEDALSIGFTEFSPTLGFHIVGVFDGHNGPYTAQMLAELLHRAVVGMLGDLYSKHAAQSDSAVMDLSGGVYFRNPGEPPDPTPAHEEIVEAIKSAFLQLDDGIVHQTAQKILGLDDASYTAIRGPPAQFTVPLDEMKISSESILATAVKLLRPAYSGSYALVGIYNTSDRSLRVALTGESRAVLGRRVPVSSPSTGEKGKGKGGNNTTGKEQAYTYEAQQLTADQNAHNPEEAARLSALHPDEPDLLKNNRVPGWGCARAFGDGAMKWSLEVQRRLHEDFLGDRPRENCKTPPYCTAEPVVTLKEGIQKGDFVVYALNGLWDCLGTEEVVGLVGKWLEENGTKERVSMPDGTVREVMVPLSSSTPSSSAIIGSASASRRQTKTYAPSELPVVYPADYKDKTTRYKYWRKEKKFVCEDNNVAAHLIRNALGGAHTDLREHYFRCQYRDRGIFGMISLSLSSFSTDRRWPYVATTRPIS